MAGRGSILAAESECRKPGTPWRNHVIAISTKPVKECKGCALNLGKQCGVFEHPVLQWKHRTCKGYNQPDLIARYEKMQNPEGARRRKLNRAERAKLAHTLTHKDGVRPLKGAR